LSNADGRAARIAIRHRIGALRLEVNFDVSAPWTVLFGASGSGKSTILRAVAGLVRPDSGRIEVQGRVLFDSESVVWVAAHRREVRWAGQRAALFPRMTVAENLAFGLRGASKEELQGALGAFGLNDLGGRKVDALSGGERRRVSVARAAVGAKGRLLLLDEPFAGLDAAVRDRLIGDVKRWVGETPVVSVTHDVGEAFLLGAEVVRIAQGRVVGQGATETVLGEERERLLGWLGEG
jgi:molybdate transport system ATP-binding protein